MKLTIKPTNPKNPLSSYSIALDDQEIATALTGLTLNFAPGQPPRAVLDIAALRDDAEVTDVESTVVLPPATHDLLVKLGWTPPQEPALHECRTRWEVEAEAAAKLALTALEGAETTCRYHGDNPPKAPAWHGGCESCQQPTRVREALAAIRALTTEETDRG